MTHELDKQNLLDWIQDGENVENESENKIFDTIRGWAMKYVFIGFHAPSYFTLLPLHTIKCQHNTIVRHENPWRR